MTDIASITANPQTVDIKHPATSEPIGLKFTLLPSSAPRVQQARRKLINERLGRDVKMTAERIDANTMSLMEAAVSGWEWEGDLTFHGEVPAFTEQNLRKVLKELPWVQAQLDAALGDDAAFFLNSASA